MAVLKLNLPVADDLAANMPADAQLIVLALPKGGLETIRAAVADMAALMGRHSANLSTVAALLDDPNGSFEAVGAALARLAREAGNYEVAAGNIAQLMAVLSTAIVTDLGVSPEDGKAVLQ